MGSFDIIKPLSTVPSCAINKSQQHQEKNSWDRQELNPGLLGAKRERYPVMPCAPDNEISLSNQLVFLTESESDWNRFKFSRAAGNAFQEKKNPFQIFFSHIRIAKKNSWLTSCSCSSLKNLQTSEFQEDLQKLCETANYCLSPCLSTRSSQAKEKLQLKPFG